MFVVDGLLLRVHEADFRSCRFPRGCGWYHCTLSVYAAAPGEDWTSGELRRFGGRQYQCTHADCSAEGITTDRRSFAHISAKHVNILILRMLLNCYMSLTDDDDNNNDNKYRKMYSLSRHKYVYLIVFYCILHWDKFWILSKTYTKYLQNECVHKTQQLFSHIIQTSVL